MSDSIPYETPGPVEENWRDAISSIEEIIEDARNGRMFILVDHEDRENEGDLVIPAQMATPEVINFMATHGRGLICLSLPGERIDALGLPLMASDNSSRHETAFTISIEAREGVTTGISAHDRARTVAVAIDPSKTANDIATPGHVFPLHIRRTRRDVYEIPRFCFLYAKDRLGGRIRVLYITFGGDHQYEVAGRLDGAVDQRFHGQPVFAPGPVGKGLDQQHQEQQAHHDEKANPQGIDIQADTGELAHQPLPRGGIPFRDALAYDAVR